MIKQKMVAKVKLSTIGKDLFKEGEILDVSYSDYAFTVHETYGRNGQIISGIRCELRLLGNDVFDYFIPIAEWREQQIKSILDDNN